MVFNLFHCAHVRVFLDGLFIHFKFALQCFFITVFQIFQAVAEKDMFVYLAYSNYTAITVWLNMFNLQHQSYLFNNK